MYYRVAQRTAHLSSIYEARLVLIALSRTYESIYNGQSRPCGLKFS